MSDLPRLNGETVCADLSHVTTPMLRNCCFFNHLQLIKGAELRTASVCMLIDYQILINGYLL